MHSGTFVVKRYAHKLSADAWFDIMVALHYRLSAIARNEYIPFDQAIRERLRIESALAELREYPQ